MKQLLTTVILLNIALNAQAQESNNSEQLLVFRNTGIVNLFFTNEVDSILSTDDSQIFYTKDTILIVPYTEIDSVAIGNRNIKEIKNDVYELTDERDLTWIIRTDGNSLYYRNDTPKDILPRTGLKLFYGNSHELLPIGLVAQVQNVSLKEHEIQVEIKPIELQDVFERYFFAGQITTNVSPNDIKQVEPQIYDKKKANITLIKGSLDVGENGKIESDCTIGTTGRYVIDLSKNYYHAHLYVEISGKVGAQLHCEENANLKNNKNILHLPLPTIGGILHPSINVNLFYDIYAEMNLNFSARRVYRFEYDWVRINGEQTGQVLPPKAVSTEDDEINADLTLKGEAYFGIDAGLDLNLIGNRIGFRFNSKLGPSFNGELGIGLLSKMRSFDTELWGKANVNSGVKLKFELSILKHDIFYIFGKEQVTSIAEAEFNLLNRKLDLFPEYTSTNAVATMCSKNNQQSKVDVNVATAVTRPTCTEILTGFEFVDPSGNILDSVFVGSIKSKRQIDKENSSTTQTFDTIMPLYDNTGIKKYTLRPIFYYAGYTISATPVHIKSDVLLQPYTFTQSNGFLTFISKGSFDGYAKNNKTTYIVGTYLPIKAKTIYEQGDGSIIQTTPITPSQIALLIGTWYGKIDKDNIKIQFNKDGTGIINNEITFTYDVNKPQSGELSISFNNNEIIVFRLISITNSELRLKNKNDKKQGIITLNR